MNDFALDGDPLLGFLSGLARTRVSFFPHAGNAGDAYIAHSTFALFDHYNISFEALPSSETARGRTVLIGGGGNLLEGMYGEVCDLIERHLQHNRVVLLPHTIYGHHQLLRRVDENFQIFCREPVTHAMALAAGADPAFVHLCHDMAFYRFDDLLDAVKRDDGEGVIQIFRTDSESAGWAPIPDRNRDISLTWNGDLWHNRALARCVTLSLAAYLAPFEAVETDRLHVAILAAGLGKTVSLHPNSYFKNQAVFQHSMQRFFPKARFINTGRDTPYSQCLLEKIEGLERRVRELQSRAP